MGSEMCIRDRCVIEYGIMLKYTWHDENPYVLIVDPHMKGHGPSDLPFVGALLQDGILKNGNKIFHGNQLGLEVCAVL